MYSHCCHYGNDSPVSSQTMNGISIMTATWLLSEGGETGSLKLTLSSHQVGEPYDISQLSVNVPECKRLKMLRTNYTVVHLDK